MADPPADTIEMQLYLDTDPPSIGQTLSAFCGEFVQPCTVDHSPFVQEIGGFAPDDVIVYRFERVTTDEAVHVLDEGRTTVGDGFVRTYTYPAD